MATRERLGALAARDREHLLWAALGALVVGLYAGWMAADLAPRWLVVAVATLVVGISLAGAETRRGQAVSVTWTLAVLVLLTPIFVVLPDVLSAGTYGVGPFDLVLGVGKLVLVAPFLLAGLALSYLAYRLDGGRGVRARLAGWRS